MKMEIKIRMKLLLGFGIIILTSAVVTLTALYAISSLKSNIADLLDTQIPQMNGVAQIRQAIAENTLHIDEAIRADSEETMRSEAAAIAGNDKATTQSLEKLKATLTSDKEKALLAAFTPRGAPTWLHAAR